VKSLNEFVIFTGCMYASKTSNLLKYVDFKRRQKFNAILIKPKKDDRYSVERVVTHDNMSEQAFSVSSGEDILELVSKNASGDAEKNLVAVDEAFMISESASALIYLYRTGFNVAVASLDMSSSCKAFEEIMKMMPWATRVEKLHAVCSNCFQPASFSYKKTMSDQDIEIGGSDMYEARCISCHPIAKIII
jgi:thymidine kinase